MDALNKELKESAIGLGLCNKWQRMWNRDFDAAELIEMWKRGMDFAIEHDYPSVDFICRNFSETDLRENGVYVNAMVDMDERLSGGTYVVAGDSTGTMRFGQWTAATVYVRHESHIRIIAGDFSKIQVRVYDSAEVETEESEGAVVRILDHRN